MKPQTKRAGPNLKKSSVLFAACAVGFLALASITAGAQQNPSADMKSMPMDHSKMEHDAKMHGMKHMEGMSMTGNADYDFAANMKRHHQMGIDMAKAEIKNGKNPQMVEMAKAIVATQTQESAAFDKYLAANTANTATMPDGMQMPEKKVMPEGMSIPK